RACRVPGSAEETTADGAAACVSLLEWLVGNNVDGDVLVVSETLQTHVRALDLADKSFEASKVATGALAVLERWGPEAAEDRVARDASIVVLGRLWAASEGRRDRNLEASRALKTAMAALGDVSPSSPAAVDLHTELARRLVTAGALDEAAAELDALDGLELDAEARASVAHTRAVLLSKRGDLPAALEVVDSALSALDDLEPSA